MPDNTLLPQPPFIEGFQFMSFLGRGGSGDVYLAKDLQTGQDVALKVVRRGPDREQFELERQGALLQQELARISPQPPQVYRFKGNETDQVFWISMEYIDGDDLATLLTGGPLTETRSVHIAIQLLEMLVLTHGFARDIGGRKVLGIIHGDLKPQNIRLQAGDRVRVLDFGIARQLTLSRSYTYNAFGTSLYSPPERLAGGEVNEQSDLWSVAVILHFLLSGRLPFMGSTDEELRLQILRGDRSPLPAGCSRHLRYVVARALNSDPKMRYLTAYDMKADLENIFHGLPVVVPSKEDGAPILIGTSIWKTRFAAWMAALRKFPGRRKAALAVAVGILLLSQLWVWREAVSIRDELLGSSPQVDNLWVRFHRIERICFFKPLLRDAPEEMKQALRKSADRILATYTEERPTTGADDWERARKYLTAAVAIDDQDVENRARLLYSQAQLSLIEGIRTEKATERRDLWNKAVAGFQRSLELDEWPDPHIALASFYDYKRFDFSHLERHVRRAWALGHPRDKRTRAILADGHLSQSRRFLKDSRDRRMSASRKVSLEEGLRHAREAISLYRDGLLDFSPDTPANHHEAMALRDEAQRGLKRFKA